MEHRPYLVRKEAATQHLTLAMSLFAAEMRVLRIEISDYIKNMEEGGKERHAGSFLEICE